MVQVEYPATEEMRGSDLTAFQQMILVGLAEEARYWLVIKGERETYYSSYKMV